MGGGLGGFRSRGLVGSRPKEDRISSFVFSGVLAPFSLNNDFRLIVFRPQVAYAGAMKSVEACGGYDV